MIARLFAAAANLATKWKLPISVWSTVFMERWLWNHPSQIKVFLSHVDPNALWMISERKLLFLLQRFVRNTPALAALAARHFPRGLKNMKDFQAHFPVLDKESYVKAYGLAELCQGGRIPREGSLYKSAGTSGNPTIWADSIQEQLSFDKVVGFIGHTLLDMVHRDYFIVNCWVMGSWLTGGNFASSARFYGAIINIGTLLDEAAETIRVLGSARPFLVAGYPPFVHALLQKLAEQGTDFSQTHIDVVVGGEGFVEEWRDSLIRRLGRKSVIFSVYGSSDKGLGEGIETSAAYGIRSLLYVASLTIMDPAAAEESWRLRSGVPGNPFTPAVARAFLAELLGAADHTRVPMVFQFDPTMYYIENLPTGEGQRPEFASSILTPWVTIPRLRYNIHDEGTMVRYGRVREAVEKAGVSWELVNLRDDPHFDLHLPFLFLFGRTDGTVSLDGANIFPNDVERCLRAERLWAENLYGLQLFITKNYSLGVALELNEGVPAAPALAAQVHAWLWERLPAYSSGYGELRRDKLSSAKIAVEVHAHASGPFRGRRVKTPKIRPDEI